MCLGLCWMLYIYDLVPTVTATLEDWCYCTHFTDDDDEVRLSLSDTFFPERGSISLRV